MSKQAIAAFREKVKGSPELQQQILSAVRGEPISIVALGKAHGCDFTPDELQQQWAELTAGGELSDFELEVVAAGARFSCSEYS